MAVIRHNKTESSVSSKTLLTSVLTASSSIVSSSTSTDYSSQSSDFSGSASDSAFSSAFDGGALNRIAFTAPVTRPAAPRPKVNAHELLAGAAKQGEELLENTKSLSKFNDLLQQYCGPAQYQTTAAQPPRFVQIEAQVPANTVQMATTAPVQMTTATPIQMTTATPIPMTATPIQMTAVPTQQLETVQVEVVQPTTTTATTATQVLQLEIPIQIQLEATARPAVQYEQPTTYPIQLETTPVQVIEQPQTRPVQTVQYETTFVPVAEVPTTRPAPVETAQVQVFESAPARYFQVVEVSQPQVTQVPQTTTPILTGPQVHYTTSQVSVAGAKATLCAAFRELLEMNLETNKARIEALKGKIAQQIKDHPELKGLIADHMFWKSEASLDAYLRARDIVAQEGIDLMIKGELGNYTDEQLRRAEAVREHIDEIIAKKEAASIVAPVAVATGPKQIAIPADVYAA